MTGAIAFIKYYREISDAFITGPATLHCIDYSLKMGVPGNGNRLITKVTWQDQV